MLLVGLSLVLGGMVAVVLYLALAGTPAFSLLLIAAILLPTIAGIVSWRREGYEWLPILSWTLPLAGWMALRCTVAYQGSWLAH